MTKVALFLNHQPGLAIAEYFAARAKDEIVAVYLSHENTAQDYAIVKATHLSLDRVFSHRKIHEPEHVHWLSQQGIEFIVSVYWPKKIPATLLALVGEGSVNCHAALLPHNRGCLPHVYSLLHDTPCGVTLHQMDLNFDTGPIWVQKALSISPYDTAHSLYGRLQQAMVALFIEHWPSISGYSIKPYSQVSTKGSYHTAKDIQHFDCIDLDQSYTARDLIKLLRARSLDRQGFAYYFDQGQKVYLQLRLNETMDFLEQSHA